MLYGIETSKLMLVLYGTLICMGANWLFLDFIIVLLGSSECLRNFFSCKGFYFDFDFQEKWNDKIDDY